MSIVEKELRVAKSVDTISSLPSVITIFPQDSLHLAQQKDM
jgi:hypothetical protein